MVVKIYGFNLTIFMTCKELNIPYEYVPVNTVKGEHKTDEWVAKMHPFGQVPVLIDEDGFKLYEQRAIARYLVRKYAPDSGFVPGTDDVQKYGLFEQAMSVEAFNFSQSIVAINTEVGYKAFLGGTPDEAVVAEHVRSFEAKLDVYEKILENQQYIAGNELTFADIAHVQLGCGLRLILKMDILANPEKRPNVARWFGELITRPSYLELLDSWTEYIKPFMK